MFETWFSMLAGIFMGTFLHEDVSLVAAAFFIVEQDLPWPWALAAVYIGMVVSDSFIYGLGAIARRLPWLRSRVINRRVARMRRKLNRNLVSAVAICRFIPGLLSPTFVACGWFGVSYWRFLLTTVVVGAIYCPVMLFLMVTFGQAVLRHVGYGAWIAVVGVIVIAVLRKKMMSPKAERTAAPVNQASAVPVSGMGGDDGASLTHAGMPSVDELPQKVSFSEYIPPLIFYVPVVVQWIFLALRYRSITLPTVANPKIEMAGLWGESKSALMRQVAPEQRKWVAAFVTIERSAGGCETLEKDLETALDEMQKSGLSFPVVVKPDTGWQGYGVRKIAAAEALRSYIEAYPEGETFILQKDVPYDGEAGLFYMRRPGEERGRIISMTFRYFPFVTGDGVSTVRALIARDERTNFKAGSLLGRQARHRGARNELLNRVPALGETVRLSFIGSLRVGGMYYDAQDFITPALDERMDAICRSMPEFYFGRFDIRFKSADQLKKAEDFSIFEINGAGSEAIHIWDPRKSIGDVYRELFRFQSLLFEIAALNRARGCKPAGLFALLAVSWHYQGLLRRYPPSD